MLKLLTGHRTGHTICTTRPPRLCPRCSHKQSVRKPKITSSSELLVDLLALLARLADRQVLCTRAAPALGAAEVSAPALSRRGASRLLWASQELAALRGWGGCPSPHPEQRSIAINPSEISLETNVGVWGVMCSPNRPARRVDCTRVLCLASPYRISVGLTNPETNRVVRRVDRALVVQQNTKTHSRLVRAHVVGEVDARTHPVARAGGVRAAHAVDLEPALRVRDGLGELNAV